MRAGYIYLINAKTGLLKEDLCMIKIGVVCMGDYKKKYPFNEVEKRMKHLQVGCPFKLEIIGIINKSESLFTTEKLIHRNIVKVQGVKRMEGEWFTTNKHKTESFISTVIKIAKQSGGRHRWYGGIYINKMIAKYKNEN